MIDTNTTPAEHDPLPPLAGNKCITLKCETLTETEREPDKKEMRAKEMYALESKTRVIFTP